VDSSTSSKYRGQVLLPTCFYDVPNNRFLGYVEDRVLFVSLSFVLRILEAVGASTDVMCVYAFVTEEFPEGTTEAIVSHFPHFLVLTLRFSISCVCMSQGVVEIATGAGLSGIVFKLILYDHKFLS